jgi:plastocyanin
VVALAALTSGAGAGATADAKLKHRVAAGKKAKRTRAVKLRGDVAFVPAGALGSQLTPLTGTAPPTGAPATTGPGGPASTQPTTTQPATAPPPPPTVQAVGVTLDDRGAYTARLSRTSVAAGSLVVQLVNQGEDDHNLRVVPTDHAGGAVDFPLTAHGTNTTKTLALTAGTYRLFCTLTTPVNHEAAGMHATLTVSP